MFAIFCNEIKLIFKAGKNAQRHSQSFNDSQLSMKPQHSILIFEPKHRHLIKKETERKNYTVT